MNSAATVFLVDDDPAVLKALARLMRLEGYDVQTYLSARAFLEAYEPRPCACLVLDVLAAAKRLRPIFERSVPLVDW